ncbi:hypothetical protein ACVMIH_007384 [Bradyrhizobium sp. USDA 4503]
MTMIIIGAPIIAFRQFWRRRRRRRSWRDDRAVDIDTDADDPHPAGAGVGAASVGPLARSPLG